MLAMAEKCRKFRRQTLCVTPTKTQTRSRTALVEREAEGNKINMFLMMMTMMLRTHIIAHGIRVSSTCTHVRRENGVVKVQHARRGLRLAREGAQDADKEAGRGRC